MKKSIQIISIALLAGVFSLGLFTNEASAQINKNNKKSSFSSTGNKWNRFRYGILGQTSVDNGGGAFIGAGFGANQYYGVGNLMFQQSLTYQIGLGDKLRHSFEASIHNNFFGGLDFSPFVWGANAMFVKQENTGQLFVRPDVGIFYPFKYRDKASEEAKYTIMLLYGYNFMLFQDRNTISVSPHCFSLKVLFSLYSYHEI